MTNPPFSEDHKERCLRWALATRKPFALLLPAYVVERRWFREAFGDAKPFFVAPQERYGFDHPLGVAASPDGSTVYVADNYARKIRAINVASGEVRTLAGSGACAARPACSARVISH